MVSVSRLRATLLPLAAMLLMATQVAAQSPAPAAIGNALKQKLAERSPGLAKIDDIRTTPMPGLYEVRVGNHVVYADAKGDFLIDGSLIDLKGQRNLTEERLEELNRVDFNALPLQDAVVYKNGNGKRRVVVFADPNCGYCKRLEKELQQVKDVTVYTFLTPILGDDSKTKSQNVWCMKDRGRVWLDWMLNGKVPPQPFGGCATPLQRNVELASKLKVNGTPAIFFEDGSRIGGASTAPIIEERLNKASAKAAG